MRIFGDFIQRNPKLFGIMGYHSGIYCVLRLGSQPEANSLIDAADDAIIEEIAQTGASFFPANFENGVATGEMGIPAIAPTKLHALGVRDATYHGHSFDSFYYHFGLLGYEVELGIAQNAVGLSAQDALDGQGFLEYEKQREASDRRLLKFWETSAKSEPLFAEWETVEHPQLGTVEVGGFLEHRHNPLLCILEPIAAGSTGFIVDHARRHPRVELASLSVTPVGDGTFKVCADVVNSGQLPSHVTNKGKELPVRFAPVTARLRPAEGCSLLSTAGEQTLGHLAATAGGRAEWFVAGRSGATLGELELRGAAGGDSRVAVAAP